MNLAHTSLGYEYFRCRRGDDDSTVYVHQLVALLDDVDPSIVFAPDHDVHHVNHVPWDNRPSNLELRDAIEHRTEHLEASA